MTPNRRKYYVTVAISIISMFLLGIIAVYSYLAGISGGEQYIYYMDTVNTMSGSYTTNVVYPSLFLQGAPGAGGYSFTDNSTSVYLAAFFGAFSSPRGGWITVNLITVIMSAALIYVMLRRVMKAERALFFSLGYLAMPMVFAGYTSILSEASTSLYVTVAVFVMFRVKSLAKWPTVAFVLGLLLINCTGAMPLMLLLPIHSFYVMYKRGEGWGKSLGYSFAALLVSAGMVYVKFRFFPIYPADTHMLALEQYQHFFINGLIGLKRQFLSNLTVTLPFNIMGIFASVVFWRKQKTSRAVRKYMLPAFVFYVLHLIIAVAFQPRTTYGLMFLPAVYMGFAVAADIYLHKFNLSKAVPVIAVAFLGIFILTDLAISVMIQEKASEEKLRVEILTEAYASKIPEYNSVMVISSLEDTFMHAYTLNPRTTILSTADKQSCNYIVDKGKPNYIVAEQQYFDPSVLDGKNYDLKTEFVVNEQRYSIYRQQQKRQIRD